MNKNQSLQVCIKDNYITLIGILDREGALRLKYAMNADEVLYILDFDKVTDVNFAAQRTLLHVLKDGKHFAVINASDNVATRLEDSGLASLFNVCRKPKPLDLSKYAEFGAGYLSKAFNSEDGDSMLKVYGRMVPKWIVAREKTNARALLLFGIPTPMVGALYEDGEATGLDFERIQGKRSFSRIISDEPKRLEEISRRFARMCLQLHGTPCDTSIFSNRADFYRKAISGCTEISEEEKAKVMSFLDAVPLEKTCLHGDMQLSNVITNDVDDLWIDLSDFGYGNHMLDMGMWYFLSMLNSEQNSQNVFHLSCAQMKDVWRIFAEEYFKVVTPEELQKVQQMVEPYAALHMLYLGVTYKHFEPGMLDFVREKLLK